MGVAKMCNLGGVRDEWRSLDDGGSSRDWMRLTQIRREREGASQWGMCRWVVPATSPTVEDE